MLSLTWFRMTLNCRCCDCQTVEECQPTIRFAMFWLFQFLTAHLWCSPQDIQQLYLHFQISIHNKGLSSAVNYPHNYLKIWSLSYNCLMALELSIKDIHRKYLFAYPSPCPILFACGLPLLTLAASTASSIVQCKLFYGLAIYVTLAGKYKY